MCAVCSQIVKSRLHNLELVTWTLSCVSWHGCEQAQVDNKGSCWFTEEAVSVKNPQEQVVGLIIMFITVETCWFLYISAILFDLLS